ncbi:MAG TPA: ROK family transcriptional regulator [Aggregatilineales bacterium]|nr:ROK family transcriptional regulator [Aggregatilineales bacterium]
MTSRKATHGFIRRENRRLLLRTVYSRIANSRVELANETGLAKPTVSDLISELIDEGYLVETGFGQSTDEGGKRPRLLEFVPNARHVIGLSLTAERVLGVLCDLNGDVRVHHFRDLGGISGNAVVDVLSEVINGLLAQSNAPLLCIGVGVPGTVDSQSGLVQYAPYLGWENLPLADRLSKHYEVPVYVANSTELAAMAHFAFGDLSGANGVNNLVTILVNENVGVGMVLNGAAYHSGGEIGRLHIPLPSNTDGNGSSGNLESRLGWQNVRQRAQPLERRYVDGSLPGDKLNYLHIREAVADQEPLAIALQDDLAECLAQVFAWVLTLLRPDHIALAGGIADLGEPLLNIAVEKARQLVWADAIDAVTFSLDNASNLIAIGAVAETLQKELGLI